MIKLACGRSGFGFLLIAVLGVPKDLAAVGKAAVKKEPRDTFVYFIHEAKLRAPAAAMALIERIAK